jgi:hypothetical protein
VTRGEANHATKPGLTLCDQQAPALDIQAVVRPTRLEGGEIVIEDERPGIRRVAYTSGAGVSRTEVAGRIIFRLMPERDFLQLALPGSSGAMRRDQNPFPGKGVQSAMRIFCELQCPAPALGYNGRDRFRGPT